MARRFMYQANLVLVFSVIVAGCQLTTLPNVDERKTALADEPFGEDYEIQLVMWTMDPFTWGLVSGEDLQALEAVFVTGLETELPSTTTVADENRLSFGQPELFSSDDAGPYFEALVSGLEASDVDAVFSVNLIPGISDYSSRQVIDRSGREISRNERFYYDGMNAVFVLRRVPDDFIMYASHLDYGDGLLTCHTGTGQEYGRTELKEVVSKCMERIISNTRFVMQQMGRRIHAR